MNLIYLTNISDEDIERLVEQCPSLLVSQDRVVLLESDFDECDISVLTSKYTWYLVKL